MGGDGVGVVHEGFECGEQALGQFLGSAGDEVAEVVGFEAQPEPFDGIKVGTVGGQELALEMMPLEPRGFVPGGVVENEDTAFARLGRDGLGELVEVTLKASVFIASKIMAKLWPVAGQTQPMTLARM